MTLSLTIIIECGKLEKLSRTSPSRSDDSSQPVFAKEHVSATGEHTFVVSVLLSSSVLVSAAKRLLLGWLCLDEQRVRT